MLLRLDNSDLLPLEFNLWLNLKGAIWPSFVVPDAFLVAVMGPDLFLPDYEPGAALPSLLRVFMCPVEGENVLPPNSCELQRCSLLTVTCPTPWFSENGNQPSDT